MTTHLYCVLPHEVSTTVPPGLSGLAGAAVRALPVEGLVAWVSDVSRGVTVSHEGVSAHDAVVEAALETGTTPVPVRFGQRFDDDDACRAALASRAASVESLLADVQGHVEMTLIVTLSTQRMLNDLDPLLPEMFEQDSNDDGLKYLETLRRRELSTGTARDAIDELTERLDDAVRSYVRRSVAHDSVTSLPLRTISHLIARHDDAAYRQAVARVAAGSESRFLLIGPRAPYSFSALTDRGGAHGMKLAD